MHLDQLIDFFEARYNINETPYITYPNRVTNLILGYGAGDSESFSSSIGEAPYTNELYARINGNWQSFVIPNTYTQSQSDNRYYPLNLNPAGYLTISSLAPYALTSQLNNYYTKTESNGLFYPLGSNPANYATVSSLDNYVLISSLVNYYTKTQIDNNFYPLLSNPSGYLVENDLAPYALISSLSNYYTKSESNSSFYPISSNPAQYITLAALVPYALLTNLNDFYSKIQSDSRYYPFTANPAGYITLTELADYALNTTFSNYYTKVQSDGRYYPIGSNPSGFVTQSSLHDPVTLGINTNGLVLINQQLSLALATTNLSGAMSANDKLKLDSVVVHNPVTLDTANGLTLVGQALSLSLATESNAGAMSAEDKTKLNSLANYVHPTGFTNQPLSALTGNTVISRILVNSQGHITGVDTRVLDITTVGIIPQALTRVNDTNLILTLGGTPATALLQEVTLTLSWQGQLEVSRGGTGSNNLTINEVLVGNGSDPVTTLSRNGIDTREYFPAEIHNLTSHSDVTLTVPSDGQVLAFNGTTWTNITLDLNNFDYEETDPIFTAFSSTNRTANTFYAGPSGSNGLATFRTLVVNDIPNVYIRFDITQTLTETQKSRVRNAIGVISDTTAYEPAFLKGNVIPNTGTPLTITNGSSRIIGTADLIIAHNTSGWTNKTTLTGANIISNLTVDSFGHISNWTTRALTLADLGFVAFDPTTIESTLDDHEDRIAAIEALIPAFPSDKNYVHVQNTAAAIWNITHNLNKKPSVTIIDSAGSIVLAKLVYVNLNTVTIDFDGSATSGEAIFN
jgi:hypothetical protein